LTVRERSSEERKTRGNLKFKYVYGMEKGIGASRRKYKED
jgi:hypothetical protein